MAEDKKLVRKTQRSSRISTVVSISLVLFLMGTLGILLVHAQRVSDYVKENIEISLILKPDADSIVTADLFKRITSLEYVKSARLVSKDEAAQALKTELGEDFITFLGYNPLYPSVDIRLRSEFADNNVINSFLAAIRSHPAVKDVQYQASLVESINRNVRAITYILTGFSVLLLLVSVALINNTIRISLYARRLLIKSMLLVGATRGFIRKPFLLSGLWNGIIGAVLALFLLGGAFYLAETKVPELVMIRDYKLIGLIAGSLLALGILLSFTCTLFAVNKYLRYRNDDLY